MTAAGNVESASVCQCVQVDPLSLVNPIHLLMHTLVFTEQRQCVEDFLTQHADVGISRGLLGFLRVGCAHRSQ